MRRWVVQASQYDIFHVTNRWVVQTSLCDDLHCTTKWTHITITRLWYCISVHLLITVCHRAVRPYLLLYFFLFLSPYLAFPVFFSVQFYLSVLSPFLSIYLKEPFVINPLNAELNPICHLLVLLGDLTFMGPCFVSIFHYISNKMQTLHSLFISGNCSTCFV